MCILTPHTDTNGCIGLPCTPPAAACVDQPAPLTGYTCKCNKNYYGTPGLNGTGCVKSGFAIVKTVAQFNVSDLGDVNLIRGDTGTTIRTLKSIIQSQVDAFSALNTTLFGMISTSQAELGVELDAQISASQSSETAVNGTLSSTVVALQSAIDADFFKQLKIQESYTLGAAAQIESEISRAIHTEKSLGTVINGLASTMTDAVYNQTALMSTQASLAASYVTGNLSSVGLISAVASQAVVDSNTALASANTAVTATISAQNAAAAAQITANSAAITAVNAENTAVNVFAVVSTAQSTATAGVSWAAAANQTATGGVSAGVAGYSMANSAYSSANAGYSTANLAFTNANTAYNNGNAQYNRANTAYINANTNYNVANSAFTSANSAFNQANNAWNWANSAGYQAGYVIGVYSQVYNWANNAWTQANAAMSRATVAYNYASSLVNKS